ncbi:hypothetical protein DITRI_Ditri01bG0075000 [Diplodiscus trichospermus]
MMMRLPVCALTLLLVQSLQKKEENEFCVDKKPDNCLSQVKADLHFPMTVIPGSGGWIVKSYICTRNANYFSCKGLGRFQSSDYSDSRVPKGKEQGIGAYGELNSGPLAPKARIIPLDQMPYF